MDEILQAYRELYPDLNLAECYFLFDEVQEVEGWEKFIDRLYSSISQRVFITGSNSKLLSREIATALRGRTITFEVYPLSFSEFARVELPGLNEHKSADKVHYIQLFERFMYQGGFPELVNQTDELRERILQEYFNVMLLRDLVERYQVSQVAILKYFCKRVIGASAGEFSVNKVYNELKSQGYKIGKNTLYGYQENVEAIYLSRFVPKYSLSVVKTEGSQKKPYVIDQGLGVALDFKLSQDKGRLLETVVALELFKQGKQIAYQQGTGECDFVTLAKGRVEEAFQVAVDLSDDETRKREVRGLVQCCQSLGLEKGYILTLNSEEQFESDGVRVEVVPAWRFFLAKT
jgi:predicted AAA+ superfamily ATPase